MTDRLPTGRGWPHIKLPNLLAGWAHDVRPGAICRNYRVQATLTYDWKRIEPPHTIDVWHEGPRLYAVHYGEIGVRDDEAGCLLLVNRLRHDLMPLLRRLDIPAFSVQGLGDPALNIAGYVRDRAAILEHYQKLRSAHKRRTVAARLLARETEMREYAERYHVELPDAITLYDTATPATMVARIAAERLCRAAR